MITVRWVAFLLAFEALIALLFVPRGVASTLLAAFFAVFFLILCWTFRASRPSATRKASS